MNRKKICMYSAVAAVIAMLFVQLPLLPSAVAADVADSSADPKQVLAFLSDVVGLDTAKYEATLTSISTRDYSDTPTDWVGYVETAGSYSLQYWDSKQETYSFLHANFIFANSTLISCGLYIDSGNPIYRLPTYSNMATATQVFLERYENFTADKQLSTIRNALSDVDGTKNATKTIDNLKLEVSVTSYATSFTWKPVFNGLEFSGLGVSFKDGTFMNFGDSRSLYAIGSTEVRITEEQAIDIALTRVKTFEYQINGKVVNNFTIVTDQVLAELRTGSKDDGPTVLYPFWSVMLPLATMYPGQVSVIRVELWADSGEVISCQAISYGGGPIPSESTSPNAQATPQISTSASASTTNQGNETVPELTYIAAAIVIVTISVSISAIALKKRNN